MERLLQLSIALFVLGVIFFIPQRIWPGVPGQRTARAGFRTDLVYWFATPLLSRPLTTLLTGLALLPILALLGVSLRDGYAGFGPIARQPAWLQAMEILVVGDFVGYWVHRWFHCGPLWPFHAVHHSSTELDWLSSVRLHPVNEAVARFLEALPVLLLGFSPQVVAAYLPFLTFYAILIHANVGWDFGPLRSVVASPTFHRWHHSSDPAALNKNFAGLFPLWDRFFGTLYLPAGARPSCFGVGGAPLPQSFLGLTLYPFRSRIPGPMSNAG